VVNGDADGVVVVGWLVGVLVGALDGAAVVAVVAGVLGAGVPSFPEFCTIR